jgi:DNA-binding MarR family transcriptional regulator
MKLVELEVLEEASRGEGTVKELAGRVGKSYLAVAAAVRSLVSRGLCIRKAGKISVRESGETNLLLRILERYGPTILTGNRERILHALLYPSTVKELSERAGVSEQTAYRLLRDMVRRLAVRREGRKYLLGDELLRKWVELGAGTEVMKVPKGKGRGFPTAFSRFPELGVDYFTREDYITSSEPSPEEILLHAVQASENAHQLTLCAICLLKNRDKLNLEKIRRLARRKGILSLWLDLEAYSEGMPVKHPESFLPWKEFVEKASLYGIQIEPPARFERISGLFQLIGERLSEKIEVYCFGGAPLLLWGVKDATKDVDLLVERKWFGILDEVLRGLGYRNRNGGIYLHDELPRVDVWVEEVKELRPTEGMKRGTRSMLYGKLEVKFLSPEAIFILKSVTDRVGDLIDMEALARRGLDWRLLEQLLAELMERGGGKFAIDFLQSLELIGERTGARVPIPRWLKRRALEEGIKLAIRLGAKTVTDLKKLLDFPEATLRGAVSELASRGEIKVNKVGRKIMLSSRDTGGSSPSTSTNTSSTG